MAFSRTLLRPTAAVFLAIAGLVVALVATAGPAAAHAVVLSTSPEDGSVVDEAPQEISVTFNESVTPSDEGTSLRNADGEKIPVDVAAADKSVVITPTEDLEDGTHLVGWRVTSDDGHPISGAFTFSIGSETEVTAGVEDSDDDGSLTVSILLWLLRGLLYVGALLSAGLLLFERCFVPRGTPLTKAFNSAVGTMVKWGAFIAAVSALLLAPVTVVWQNGGALGDLISGSTWLQTVSSAPFLTFIVVTVALILAAFAGRQYRVRPNPFFAVLLAMGVIGGAVALTFTGHTRTVEPIWLVAGSDVIHVAAGAFWLGGLAGLCLAFKHLDGQIDVARCVSRFSAGAVFVVAVLAATGVVMAWQIFGAWSPLWETTYGWLLLAKVGVVGVIVLIAAWNKFKLVPAVENDVSNSSGTSDSSGVSSSAEVTQPDTAHRFLRRSVIVEGFLLLVVLAVTGVLVSQSPQDAASADDGEVASEAEEDHDHHELASGMVHVQAIPGEGRDQEILIEVSDDDGPLELDEEPTIQMNLPDQDVGPLDVEVIPTERGSYEATFSAPIAGDWEGEVDIRFSKFEQEKLPLNISVN